MAMTAEKWKAFARTTSRIARQSFLKLYPGDTDEQALRSAIDFGGDHVHRLRHLEVD